MNYKHFLIMVETKPFFKEMVFLKTHPSLSSLQINKIVKSGTSSGMTTTLSIISNFNPSEDRHIEIQDTKEIS